LVALFLGTQNFFERNGFPPYSHFSLTSASSFARIGYEDEFTGGVGKDNSTLITPFTDYVSA